MEENREQLRRLRDYLARTQGERYPFRGHRLEKENHYIQNLYLKHLCLAAQAGAFVDEMQTLFLQRLITGCGAEYDRGTYLRQGGEADENSLEELFEQLEKHGLRQAFLLDVLLMIHLGAEDRERDEFAAQLCAAMRITPDELVRLARMCAAVLRLDLPGCLECDLDGGGEGGVRLWAPYLPEELPPVWKMTEDMIAVWSPEPMAFEFKKLKEAESIGNELVQLFPTAESNSYDSMSCVRFEERVGAAFYGLTTEISEHIYFANVEKVQFVGCTLIGDGRMLQSAASLWFENCPQISFQDCTFQNFGGRVICLKNCDMIMVKNCVFENCTIKYYHKSDDWRDFGGVIKQLFTTAQLTLRGSRFVNCRGINGANYYVSSILSDCAARIYDCRFENCWHLYNSMSKDPADPRRCLFGHIVEESGNEVIDSAELGPH